MRREDWVNRDLERVGGEYRTTAKDRSSWRLVIENIVSEKKRRRNDDRNQGQRNP